MKFYVSDAVHTSRKATGVLHVTPRCMTLANHERLAREASITEVLDAYTLCGACAPAQTGQSKPEVAA